ncbi:transcription factor bHLH95-like [Rosa rugosa]|uniref:transcription factor bHLH95-like n=1 Tax=Rosa rugosa TaxID=74645 RepID=UPI002B403DDF|nr:transcription factor bHLH95-like [Rosa rugosa]
MSEREAGAGGSDGVLWESQSWVNLSNSTDNFLLNSNSENSAGGGDEGENKLGEKEKEMMEREDRVQPEVEPVAAPGKKTLVKKRVGRGGGSGVKKHNGKATKGKGKGSSDGVVEEGKGGGGDSEDDHELHIYTERERRKKMRNMFANLHALLPQLPSKADKSTIVDEAVSYIKRLEITLQSLQQQKRERMRSLPGSSMVNHNHSSVLMNSQNVAYDSREAFLSSHASSSNLAAASTTTANGFNINPDFNPLNHSLSTNSLSTEPIVFETWTSSNVVLNMCRDEAQISVCSPKKPGVFTQICFILEKYKIVVVTAHIISDSHRSMYMIQAQPSRAPDNQFLEMFPAVEIFKQAVSEINVWIVSTY